MSAIYSLEEVSKHQSKDDLWMVVHNKVYDITSFVQEVKHQKKSSIYI